MDNGSNNTLNITPSVDAIAEFKVLTSNFGAQYGRNGSGTVEIETKSGTAAFHGDVYEFVRNDDFNATPFGLTAPPEYKKNDFGFRIGGHSIHSKVYNTNKRKRFLRLGRSVAQSFRLGLFWHYTGSDRGESYRRLFRQCSVVGNPECPVVPALINNAPASTYGLVAGGAFPNSNLAP